MKHIYKYKLGISDYREIKMPKNAQVLTVKNQNNDIFIWAIVNPLEDEEVRSFMVFGTGNDYDLSNSNIVYIDTVIINQFVWHVFEYTGI